jgi:hypothetical protein
LVEATWIVPNRGLGTGLDLGKSRACNTFVVDCRVLGLANYPEERWTLTFDGEKLNVRVNFGTGPEISIDGETGA